MLQEAIQEIRELAVGAAKMDATVAYNDDPRDPRKYVRAFGNELVELTAPPPVRSHTVRRLDDLIHMATRVTQGSVWHDPDKVVLLWDDADRRDKVTMPLPQTKAWETILKLNGQWYSQKDFLRLLRMTLRGVLHDPTLLLAAKSIKFSQSIDGHAQVGHGDESLGQSVLRQLTGAQEFPEQCRLTASIYRDFDESEWMVGLDADVEIDIEKQKFALVLNEDELVRAIDSVQDRIHERLIEVLGDTPVYYGTP